MGVRKHSAIRITDADIATIEALHDTILDRAVLGVNSEALTEARALTKRMYEALDKQRREDNERVQDIIVEQSIKVRLNKDIEEFYNSVGHFIVGRSDSGDEVIYKFIPYWLRQEQGDSNEDDIYDVVSPDKLPEQIKEVINQTRNKLI